MEQEISSGTMLGIVLIALAAVIGLGFGVFSIAKGVANEGTVGVQDNLGSVSDSAFDDYNDKIVTGTMVKSAIQNFKGKSVAILVNTTAMNKAVKPYAAHEQLNVWAATDGGEFVLLGILSGEDKDITYTASTGGSAGKFTPLPDGISSDDIKKFNYYVNYNALLGNCDAVTSGSTTNLEYTMGNTGCLLKLKDGYYEAKSIPFMIDNNNGKVMFDYSVGGQSRTGNCEYLNATAKFDANLIKDETGTTLGIVFTQRAQ